MSHPERIMAENSTKNQCLSGQVYANPTYAVDRCVEENRSYKIAKPSAEAPCSSAVNQNGPNHVNQLRESTYGDPPTLPHDGEDSAVLNNESQRKSRFTLHQKVTLVSVLLASFATWLTYSIMAVFFPVEAKAKGVSQTVTGLVFSSFSIAAGIGSPLWGKILPIAGARFIFLAGAFVTGSCNILFGFLAEMPTQATFVAFSFIIRILEGLGSSACQTASAAILAFTFPDNVGTAVSLTETMSGLSFTIGPAMGGLLYNAGGFRLPFFVLGGLVLLSFGINFFLMPEQGTRKEKTGSVFKLLKIPAISFVMFTVFAGNAGITFIDPTLSLHLKQLNFSVTERSLIFTFFGLTYAVISVMAGRIADVKKTTRIMIAMGAFSTAVFYLLIGPSPLLKIHPSKLLIFLASPLWSLSFGLTMTPAFADMMFTAEWYGFPGDLALSGVIAGLWSSSQSIGTMVGPLIAGALTDRFGFCYGATILSGCFIVILISICLFGVWEYRCGKGRRLPRSRLVLEAKSTDETHRLLPPDDAQIFC